MIDTTYTPHPFLTEMPRITLSAHKARLAAMTKEERRAANLRRQERAAALAAPQHNYHVFCYRYYRYINRPPEAPRPEKPRRVLHGAHIRAWRDQLVSASALKRERGWTDTLISRLLGAPDDICTNPYYKSAAPMRRYSLSRVRAVEATEAFCEAIGRAYGRRAA